ncbi:hypothetical protein CLI82_09595 [Porphyromonas gingivalis]|nr:hypothetical protein CLI82_09595 [Porphyromonas gingivalis]
MVYGSVCSVYNGDLFGRYIDEELHEAYLYYIREPVRTTASAAEAFLDRQQELLSERLQSMKKHNCGSKKDGSRKK